MFLIEIHPGNGLDVISLRDSEFSNVSQEFVNGLKSYIIDEVQDPIKQAAYCTAINNQHFLIKNQVIDEVVFDGVLQENTALVQQPEQPEQLVRHEQQSSPVVSNQPEINYESISGLDLARALQEQIEVIKYLTALNNHIANLAQVFLDEIPDRRAQLDNAERLLSSIVNNPLLGVAKRNELGELSLSQTELDNLMAMFNKPGSSAY